MFSALLLVISLLEVAAVRNYCPGKTCATNTDCTQPNGQGGTLSGVCCNSQCYVTGTQPLVAKGGNCSQTDACMSCANGLLCSDSSGGTSGPGPFACNSFIKQFTPGCKCANDTQCIGSTTQSRCGSSNSVCLVKGLYAGSSCQFGEQCISGWCDGGSCRGFSTDPTATCTTSNQCPLGQRCSAWGVPAAQQCHPLSGEGGICYDGNDCSNNYNNYYPSQECVKTSGTSVTGRCTTLSNLGDACSTTTTTVNCAYYTENGITTRYSCNTTNNPPRCVKPAPAPHLPRGAPCNASGNPTIGCQAGVDYCDTNTTQPPTRGINNDPGVCTAIYNRNVGDNCSSFTYSCANNGTCSMNVTSGVYTCIAAVDSTGKACNYSNSSFDTAQCPVTVPGVSLFCGCDNTCQRPATNNLFCGTATTLHYRALIQTFTLTPATMASASYGDRAKVADYLCCNECANAGQLNLWATSTGVIVDCKALTIQVPQICDNSFVNQKYLQNCPAYVPLTSGGHSATWTWFTVAAVFIALIVQ